MAQNTWINITADKSIGASPTAPHRNTVSGGASASGDFTISFDNTVVTSLNIFDSLVRSARTRLAGAGLK